ncbi:MAG: hypothetical protein KKB79_01865 [Nanoarchaeota archaeon]|nr:hypothetical protein [Nanoarchaeota archaeon]
MKKDGKRNFLVLESKKGLSEIVATLLVILLVIIAIGIIWGVLRNVISSGSEEITFSGLTLDLKITRASVIEGVTTISVRRNAGSGDVSGLRFVFFDGENSQSVDRTTSLLQGEEKTFTITDEEITGVENGWTISVAPIYLTSSGADGMGGVTHVVILGQVTPAIGGGDGGGDVCGDLVCQASETELTCPEDCSPGEPPGAACIIDDDCQIGYSCVAEVCSETCNYNPVESICDRLGTYQCGLVTVCGQSVDCTAVLGECALGEYCSVNTCTADTITNTGTIEEVFTNAEPFQLLSADIPNIAVQNLQRKWISFVDLVICRQISFHGPVPEGTGYYLRLTATAPGIVEDVTVYNVWENSECGGYYS